MSLKFAFLGAWHSHAVMHVREAAQRPDELELLGMYDPDAEVIASNRERWAWYERAKSCTSPGFRFFLSIKEEGSAAKWFAP